MRFPFALVPAFLPARGFLFLSCPLFCLHTVSFFSRARFSAGTRFPFSLVPAFLPARGFLSLSCPCPEIFRLPSPQKYAILIAVKL